MNNDSRVIPFPVSRFARSRALAFIAQCYYCRLFDKPYKEAVTTPKGRRRPQASERAAAQLRQYLFGSPDKNQRSGRSRWDEELGRSVSSARAKSPYVFHSGL